MILCLDGRVLAEDPPFSYRDATPEDFPHAILYERIYENAQGWTGNCDISNDDPLTSPVIDVSTFTYPSVACNVGDTSTPAYIWVSYDDEGEDFKCISEVGIINPIPKNTKRIRFTKGVGTWGVSISNVLIIDALITHTWPSTITPEEVTVNSGNLDLENSNSAYVTADKNGIPCLDVSFNLIRGENETAPGYFMFNQYYNTTTNFYYKVGDEWIKPTKESFYSKKTYIFPIPFGATELRCFQKDKYANSALFSGSNWRVYSSMNLDHLPSDFYPYDVDGDGILEFLNLSYYHDLYKISEYGSYKWVESNIPTLNLPVHGFEDFNSDGNAELYTQFGIYEIDSTSPNPSVSPLREDTYNIVNPIDFNNDGRKDFLFRDGYSSKKIIKDALTVTNDKILNRDVPIYDWDSYFNVVKGEEYFVKPPVIPGMGDMSSSSGEKEDPLSFVSYLPVDMNGDGEVDFLDEKYGQIFYNFNGNLVQSYIGQNSHVRDLSGDGIPDYVVYDEKEKGVYAYINDGKGILTPKLLISGMNCTNIWLRDVDKDNDVDILCAFDSENSDTYGYLIILENQGNGKFKKHEYSAGKSVAFKDVVDFDCDGNYEVLYFVYEGGIDSYYRTDTYKYLKLTGTKATSYPLDRVKGSASGYKTAFYVYILDIYGDGRQGFIAKDSSHSDLLYLTDNRNQMPEKPSSPKLSFNSVDNTITLWWERGRDKETPSADLTYELRVGTAPDKADVVWSDALSNGRRRNNLPGNQGYALSRKFNIESWPAGKYYISLQVVDCNGGGSQFSEPVMFEKPTPSIDFELSYEKPISTQGIVTATLVNKVEPSYSYNWSVEDGEILERGKDNEFITIRFNAKGTKSVELVCKDSYSKPISIKSKNVIVDAIAIRPGDITIND